MKKVVCLGLLLTVMLCGCHKAEYETVSDEFEMPPIPAASVIRVDLPQDAAAEAISSDKQDRLYLCDGYTLTVQTLSAGDLDRTLLAVTGFHKEGIAVFSQQQAGNRRYDFVWTCAGEGGDQLCRGAVLDDGNYHYVVTAMAPGEEAGDLSESWNRIFGSFSLED